MILFALGFLVGSVLTILAAFWLSRGDEDALYRRSLKHSRVAARLGKCICFWCRWESHG